MGLRLLLAATLAAAIPGRAGAEGEVRPPDESEEEKAAVKTFNESSGAPALGDCEKGGPCVALGTDGKRVYRNLPDSDADVPAAEFAQYVERHQAQRQRASAPSVSRDALRAGAATVAPGALAHEVPKVPEPVAVRIDRPDPRASTILGEYTPGGQLKHSPQIAALQPALKQLGLYQGKVDGRYGPLMRDAVDRFSQLYNYQHAAENAPMARGGVLSAWDRDTILAVAGDRERKAKLQDAARAIPVLSPAAALRVDRSGEVIAAPDKGVFASAQRDLNTLRADPKFAAAFGAKPLAIDNKPGGSTRADLKAFQAAAGLPATGRLDPDTMRKLFMESTLRRMDTGSIAPAPLKPDRAPTREAKSTTYYPYNVSNLAMEGGPYAFKDGSPISTLEDYLSGRTNAVTLAGYRSLLGQKVLVEGLEKAVATYCVSNFCIGDRADPKAAIPGEYLDLGAARADVPTRGRDGLGSWANQQRLRIHVLK